jgi:hypothetical protein
MTTTHRSASEAGPIGLTSPRRRRRAGWVPPLMAGAVVLLLGGLWEGLVYLGFPLPAGNAVLHSEHGPLMVLGFLGTLIALERAVALGPLWAYLAPAAAALGGVLAAFGLPGGAGPALVTLGGAVLVAIFVAVHRIQPSLHNTVLASGAVCWVVAGLLWLIGWDVPRFVPWLVGFLVLTITGERLELSRMGGSGRTARLLFAVAAGVFTVGLIASLASTDLGVRIAGVGLVLLSAWLARWDIARRTIRARGLPRFMAAALLTGYAWLLVGGVLWISVGRLAFTDLGTAAHGSAYDAMLHAIFLGFVFSMIFAHAPVIVPSVLGRPLPFHRGFYLPLVLLHVTVLLRILGGDAAGNVPLWRWSGVLNEITLLLFIAMAAAAVVRGRRSAPDPRPATRRPGRARA